jgi:hypothetical protein
MKYINESIYESKNIILFKLIRKLLLSIKEKVASFNEAGNEPKSY